MSTRQQRSPEEQRRADLARIHILKKDLGWGDEEYRNTMLDKFWASSAADLSPKERGEFIRHLAGELEKKGKRDQRERAKKNPQSMADFPTPGQQKMIDGLASDIRWDRSKGEGVRGFCMRMLEMPWPQTKGQAREFIEHLKHMKANQQRKRNENM